MTLTELKYIVAVARVKHFGKAADECFVSQPTLSVGIRKLEDSLGITIFERGRSEVKITPIGQAIINQAQSVLSEAEVIKSIAVADKHQLRDPVKIASSYTIGKYLFPGLLKQIYNFAPDLSVSLSQDYHEKLINKLLNKELDLLILSTNVINSNSNIDINHNIYNLDDVNHSLNNQDLCFQPILQEELYILAAKNNKLSNPVLINQINYSDLLLLNNQHCLHSQALSLDPIWYENKETISTNIKFNNIDSLEALYDQVVLETGIAVVPAMFGLALKHNNNDAAVQPLSFNNTVYRILSLVWRSDFPRMQVVDAFKYGLKNINMPGLQVVL